MLTRTIRPRLARSIRQSRSVSTSSESPIPPPLPPLSSLHPPSKPTASFPLYNPPQSESVSLESQYRSGRSGKYRDLSPSELPSDKSIQQQAKLRLTLAAEEDLPEWTEDDLREFYAAVVRSGAEGRESQGEQGEGIGVAGPSRQRGRLSAPGGESGSGRIWERDREHTEAVLERLVQRLIPPPSEVTGESSDQSILYPNSTTSVSGSLTRSRLEDIVTTLSRLAEEHGVDSGQTYLGGVQGHLPLGLVSKAEGRALLRQAVHEGDPAMLMTLLDILPRLSTVIERQVITELLEETCDMAEQMGGRQGLERGRYGVMQVLADVLSRQGDLQPAEQEALIRVRLQIDPTETSAISMLRRSERLAQPLSQPSYHLVLSHLTAPSRHTSASRALAWDLFTHMRLVAHPHPSREVFTTMMASCAASAEPKPEMARDLWIQMTQESQMREGGEKIDPAEPEYTAYIHALSSTKSTYLEGFDVFRQMLARHQEATYIPFQAEIDAEGGRREMRSRYMPTRETWKALMEGTKRAGDLARARWALSECVRLQLALTQSGQGGEGLDAEIMASVFMTYAAFRPVLRRSVVREKDVAAGAQNESGQHGWAGPDPALRAVQGEQGETGELPTSIDRTETTYDGDSEVQSPRNDTTGMFGSRIPMTSAEVIHEARLLFEAITMTGSASESSPGHAGVFADVGITTRLVNSYLSVIYAHASSISECELVFDEVWAGLEAEPNGWTFLHALERCAVGQRNQSGGTRDERRAGLEWAEKLWAAYTFAFSSLSDRITSKRQIGLAQSLGVSPRQVERCWRAIIRVHALNDDTNTALRLLSQFHELYPPSAILSAYSPIQTHGFAITFTDPTTTAEGDVPPHLLFTDVDVLHQRLVRDEQWKDVGRVKWICQAYEAALGKRRKWRVRGMRDKRDELWLGRQRRRDQQDRMGRQDMLLPPSSP